MADLSSSPSSSPMSLASSYSSSTSYLSGPELSWSSLSAFGNTPDTEIFTLFGDEATHLPETAQRDQYILVVGGLGYIGSHTTWELLKEGYNVIVIDNLSNSYLSVLKALQSLVREHFKIDQTRPSLKFYEVDYRNGQTIRLILKKYSKLSGTTRTSGNSCTTQASKISGVIHFAAYKAVGESIRQPLKYYSNNVGGLINFCSALGEFGIKKLIFSSSATVYGGSDIKGDRIPEEHCTHEETVYYDSEGQQRTTQGGCNGLTNPYGRTKWMCEAILNDLAVADPDWTIFALRYFNPIGCDASGMLGESPRGTPNNLLPMVVKAMVGELPVLNIYGSNWETKDGTAIRDYIHVTDLARGHLAALDTAAAGSRTLSGFRVFNLGTGNGHSVLEVVAAMEAVSKRKIKVRAKERRAGDVAICVADPSKAEAELNWKAGKSLGEACEDICHFLGICGESRELA